MAAGAYGLADLQDPDFPADLHGFWNRPGQMPAKLTHYVAKPIRFRYGPEDAGDPQKVARLHRRVVGAMRELLTRGLQERAGLE